MEIPYAFEAQEQSIIKVIGVGGGGGNAVNSMFNNGIKKVDFIICNTDLQVLEKSPIPKKIRLGLNLTGGLGCGANPEIGKKAALESIDEIRELLKNNKETRMLFVTAGMGGGTGTGAAPVIAALAKDMGILTVGIVTTPFDFEGTHRLKVAIEGIKDLEKAVDTLLVINNTNILQLCPEDIQVHEAYDAADKVLHNAAKGIAEIITIPGHINVDFADVEAVMKNSGTAIMGMATYDGKDRAKRAIEEALASPLLDNVNISGATGALVNISTAEGKLSLGELRSIGDFVQNAIGNKFDTNTIIGHVYNNDLGNALSVTVIVTGFNKKKSTDKTEENIQNALDDVNKYLNQVKSSDAPAERSRSNAVSYNVADEAVPTPAVSVSFENLPKENIENAPAPGPARESIPPKESSSIKESPKEMVFETLEFTIVDSLLEEEARETPSNRVVLEPIPVVAEKQSFATDSARVSSPSFQEPTRVRLSRMNLSPEERIARIKQRRAEMDLTNQKSLNWVETTPAYVRRNVDVENENEDYGAQVSRMHLKPSSDGKSLFGKNPYIYDAVD